MTRGIATICARLFGWKGKNCGTATVDVPPGIYTFERQNGNWIQLDNRRTNDRLFMVAGGFDPAIADYRVMIDPLP